MVDFKETRFDDYVLDHRSLIGAARSVWESVPFGHGDWDALGDEAQVMWLLIVGQGIAAYNTLEEERKIGTVSNSDPL